MKQPSFDDIIKCKAERYEAAVPADAWENIAREKKKRRRFIFLWWIPGVLLAGTVFVVRHQHTINPGAIAGHPATHVSVSNNTGIKNNVVSNQQPVAVIRNDAAANQPITTISYQKESLLATTVKHTGEKQAANNTTVTGSSVWSMQDPPENGISLSSYFITMARREWPALVYFNIKNPAPGIRDSMLCPLISDSVTIAQALKKASPKKPGWTIEFGVTPFIPIQKNDPLLSLKRTETGADYTTAFTADKIHTSLQPSLALALAARKRITKKLEIGAGIQYARTSERVELSGTETKTSWVLVKRLKNDNGTPRLVDDTAKTVTTGARIINASNSYTTISVPLFVQYKIMERRLFSLQLNTGVFVNLYRKYNNSINGDFQLTYTSGKQPGRQTAAMNVDIFAGLRISTRPRKRIGFFAEPVFRYGLQENNSAGMINAKYLHQAGLSIGGSYTID